MEAAKHIRIKISPGRLKNPDLDLRYILPDLIVKGSEDFIKDDGYDYLEDQENTMALYLKTNDPDSAIKKIFEVIETGEVLRNDLRKAVEIEVEEQPNSDIYQSIYKPF